MTFRETIETWQVPADAVRSRTAAIHDRIRQESRTITTGNFTRLSTADLGLLFRLYDEAFFAGGVRETLGPSPLIFPLSRRLTNGAGKAIRGT